MSEKLQNIALSIVRQNDKVLLIERKHKEEGHNNQTLSWVFPGGKIEIDETPFTAAERETYEETGYYVEATKTLDERQHPSFPAHIHYIACQLSKRNPDLANDSGVIQAKWVPIAKLSAYITSSLNKNVYSYLNS